MLKKGKEVYHHVNHLVSVKLVEENSRETFEGQISTVKIDLKKKKTILLGFLPSNVIQTSK